jgi:hypothetical protein
VLTFKTARPGGRFVDLQPFGVDAADQHRSLVSIADRQGLGPLPGRPEILRNSRCWFLP